MWKVSPSKEKEEIEPVGKDSDLKLAVAEAEAQQEAVGFLSIIICLGFRFRSLVGLGMIC